MRLSIETEDLDTMCLLVKFLSESGFKVKSKDDDTLHRPVESAPEPSKAPSGPEANAEVGAKTHAL